MRTESVTIIVGAAALALTLTACGTIGRGQGSASAATTLSPTAGNSAAGTVTFQPRGSRTVVTARITGLKPNAEHGFHVHEKGDCSSADASSAGGHFNPGGQPHAFHGVRERHAGDMPNLRADANGVASLSWDTDLLTVDSGPAGVLGRSVVVHRDPDDFRTQPAGNSGPRLACGVITQAR